MDREKYLKDPRFKGIQSFESKVWLSSPTMHGDEEKWVVDAIRTNWVSTVGENINIVGDAAESLETTYNGIQTGCFGDVSIVSMNGNNVLETEMREMGL